MVLKCAICDDKECYDGKDCTALREQIEKKYSNKDKKSMKLSASIEAKYYMKLWTAASIGNILLNHVPVWKPIINYI